MTDGSTDGTSRRDILLSASTLPLLGIGEWTTPVEASTVAIQAPTTYLQEVTDPYIVAAEGIPYFRGTRGWNRVDSKHRRETIHGLHADKLDAHVGVDNYTDPLPENLRSSTGQLRWFGLETSMPVSAQSLYAIINSPTIKEWYRTLSDDEKFTGPEGDIAATTRDLSATWLDGEPQSFMFGGIEHVVPSLHINDILSREITAATEALRLGFSDHYLDNAALPGRKRDFSRWARAAFRRHLQSLPETRHNELGISDPETFDIVSYITENDLVDAFESPGANPVLREFVLFHHESHRDFMLELTAGIRENLPEREENDGLNLVGNQGLFSFSSLYISDAFDAIYMEEDHTVPPDRYRDFTYKLGVAAGRFEKPVLAIGNLIQIGNDVDTTGSLNPGQDYPSLIRLQVGEGYANGGIRTLPLTGWASADIDDVVDHWIAADGSVPAELQSLADFLWKIKRFVHHDEPANDVAVVLSLPTLLWRTNRYWPNSRTHEYSFKGAAAVCRSQQFPYDAIMFGHPRLWEDPDQLDRLTEYDTVVLPSVESVTDDQVAALESALDSGTEVIVSGDPPSRTESFQPRDDVEDLLGTHSNAVLLNGNPAREAYDSITAGQSLVDSLSASGRQVRIESGDGIGVNVRRQPELDRTVVHLVNYNYDPESDSVETRSQFNLTLETDREPATAKWLIPERWDSVDIETADEGITVELPHLEEWGVLVLGETTTALESPGSESEASDSYQAAVDAISTAASEDRTGGLELARVALRESELAKNAGAFDQAATAAEHALERAEAATKPVTIGIDQAHQQPDSERDYGQFAELRDHFSEYNWSQVTEWSSETFNELDVLLVPSVQEEFQVDYDFTTAELDAVDDFVQSGGSLVVTGQGGMAAGVNHLLERFGMAFDRGMLSSGGDQWGDVEARATLTEPIESETTWPVRFGTPLAETTDATIRGRVLDDSTAWINRENGPQERDSNDVDAAGHPVLAHKDHGDGTVIAIGETTGFLRPFGEGTPQWSEKWELVHNTLRATGPASGSTTTASPSETATANQRSNTGTTASDSSGDEQTQTSTSTPGFSIATAVAALVGFAAMLRRYLKE